MLIAGQKKSKKGGCDTWQVIVLTWLILILVAALVIGPITYLLPSAKDKRLAALRLHARQLGLTVKLSALPKLDPTPQERVNAAGEKLNPEQSCVAYQLPMIHDLGVDDDIVLVRVPLAPTIVFHSVRDGWALSQIPTASEQTLADVRVLDQVLSIRRLTERLESATVQILGWHLSPRYIAIYWDEKGSVESGEAEEIRRVLDAIREDLPLKVDASGPPA